MPGWRRPTCARARALDLAERRALVDDRAAAHDGHQQVLERRARRDALAPRRVERVHHDGRLAGPALLVEDHVGHEAVAAPEAPHLLDAGVRDLGGLLRDLDAVAPGAARPRTAASLYTPPSADWSPPVTSRVPTPQASMRAPCSLRLAMSCSSRSLLARILTSGSPASSRMRRASMLRYARSPESSRIAIAWCPRARSSQRGLRRAPHAVERVVRVDQEHRVVRLGARPGLERLRLVVEGHHPAVRVGAAHREPQQPSGERVRGRVAASDEGRARRRQPAVDALRAAQAEVEHLVAARGERHARGLRRDERLEVHEVEERGLHELGLQQRSAHAHERLVREDHGALGHGVHVAAQPDPAELVEEARVEERPGVVARERREVGEVRRSPKRKPSRNSSARSSPQATAKPPPNGCA